MKINVNEYNEILSYEGTPEELAEFIATGILFPYMENEEECNCEQDESVIVPDAMDEDSSTQDLEQEESFKEKLRNDLVSDGYECSDEEFENAYKIAVEIMGPFEDLLG